jgi:hypothetical protein
MAKARRKAAKRIRYLCVGAKSLRLTTTTARPNVRNSLVIPVGRHSALPSLGTEAKTLRDFERFFRYRVFYPALDHPAPDPSPARASMVALQPWLLAVAYVAWEGVIQGLSWDAVKLACHAALNRLNLSGVGPGGPGETIAKATTRVFAGLDYAHLASDASLRRMFLGFKYERSVGHGPETSPGAMPPPRYRVKAAAKKRPVKKK